MALIFITLLFESVFEFVGQLGVHGGRMNSGRDETVEG